MVGMFCYSCGYRGPTFKELVAALIRANLWNVELQEEYKACFRTNPCPYCGLISFKNGFKHDHHNLAFLMDLAVEQKLLKSTNDDPNDTGYTLLSPQP